MGLIIGIIGIVITLLLCLLMLFANGMSDAPSQDGINAWPTFIIGMGISIVLIVTHYHHFTW